MPEGYRIKVASREDSARVTALLTASYPNLMALDYDADLLADVLPLITRANPDLLSSGSFYLVIGPHRTVSGCGGWTRERPPGIGKASCQTAHIRHFATHPSCLRQGIGQAIYARCEEEARRQGILKFECYSSLNGEPFYKAMGFERIGREDVPLPHALRLPAVLMERPI